ncbi:MAG: proline--tRNA ligase [Bacilli bacterium]|nr:proline--tRNA ligase [Bacilli bacterium]
MIMATVNEITNRDVDFAKWYTDICRVAELIDYSSVKGSMIIKPYGYAIWENIQKILDKMFKELGHENVQMPMFIPESLLNVEKDHIEGFAPEVAWVTMGGNTPLEERYCVRPTSETLFCDHYKKIIKSYRDLPKLYNQWCTIVRWEKTTRPFLRSREILWQEGHTMHRTEEEARNETITMWHVYEKFQKEYLALPVIVGKKTEKEKFAGAEETYTIEAMMQDGVALQNGTSHYFGQKFAKAFDIEFLDQDNTMKTPYQTSWGVTTRMIGGLIMTHSDDNGLVLPPKIAPIQVIFIPIGKDEQVLNKIKDIINKLPETITTKIDLTDKSPGYKFAEAEVKGIPLRIDLGNRDLENNTVTLVRRDTLEKTTVSLENIEKTIQNTLEDIQNNLYKTAEERRNKMLHTAKNYEEFKKITNSLPGFIKINWCGEMACEEKIKDETGYKSRCILIDEKADGNCAICGKNGKHKIYFGKQY